jgi:hypothetical protein
MGWFERNKDPIEAQQRELERELDRVRKQIRRLETHGERRPSRTQMPERRPIGLPAAKRRRPAPPPTPANDPIFEDAPTQPVATLEAKEEGAEPDAESRELYNHDGVRKYDLVGLFRRIRIALFGAKEEDKKLINYLAAGSIHGLRPLRHEKRVARNRALLAAGGLIAAVWIVIAKLVGAP